MQGTSGTYAFNGTPLLMLPTSAKWVDRDSIGNSGEGRPTYPSVRKYQMTWNYMSMQEFSQIVSAYQSVQNSGSIVADLPKYGTSPYQFYSYSGVILQEPTVGDFFEQNVSDVTLLILKVRTL